MTTRLAILPYGPSDSCNLLRDALRATFETNPAVSVSKLKLENSTFRGRRSDVIVNYGNRSAPAQVFGSATVLNSQASLNNAANKLTALNRMHAAAVSVIPYTTDRAQADAWLQSGEVVYQRETLTGHSGEGITTISVALGNQNALRGAPLYTKGISGQRREWRIHVFKGVITYVQVKRRANGFQENPDYREDVRNHHTGWIYATENINPTDAVLRNAVNAVAALGLDFGAVDIISRQDSAWVLEVNTAPGLSGTNLETFTRNVAEFVNAFANNREARYAARFPTPAPFATTTTPTPAAPAAPAAPEAPRAAAQQAAPVAPQPVADAVRETVQAPSAGSPVFPSDITDGYYLADVVNADGRVLQRCVLWIQNRRAWRHGWNAPVSATSTRNLQKINSFNIAGSDRPLNINL